MATLTNTKIKDTYDGLLKTTDNDVLDVSGVTLIEDGLGNASALSLGRANNGVTITGALVASGLTYPTTDGTVAGQAIVTDAAGNLSFATVTTDTPTLQEVTTEGATTTDSITVGGLNTTGNITANSFIKTAGLSSQFLKADGSVDSNAYLTSESDTLDSVTGRGSTTANSITVGGITAAGYVYPTSGGSAGQAIVTDGAGNLSFATVSGATPTLDQVTAAGDTSSRDIEVNGLTIGKGNNSRTNNAALGVNALFAVTTGNQNTAIGSYALEDNTIGINNTAIGYRSLYNNISGASNVAIGNAAMGASLAGNLNIAIGSSALNDGDCEYSVAIGDSALSNNTSNNNTSIGARSLTNINGANNVALGFEAGDIATGGLNKTLGDNNVYIGANVVSAAQDTDNEIVIGANAVGNGSNTATYGDSSIIRHYFTSGKLRINSGSELEFGGTSVSINGNSTSNTMNFYVNTSLAMQISSSAVDIDSGALYVDRVSNNVGIGTSSPNTTLEIAKDDIVNGVKLRLNNTHNGSDWGAGSKLGVIDFYSEDISAGAGVRGGIELVQSGGSATYASQTEFVFKTFHIGDYSERMRIDSSGNVGIGVTPSSYNGIASTKVLAVGGAGNNGVNVVSGTTSTGSYMFSDSGGNDRGGLIYYHTADLMTVHTAGSERMRITSGGQVLIGTQTAQSGAQGGGANILTLKSAGNNWGVGPSTSFGNFYVVNSSNVGVYLTSGATSWIQLSDERQKDIIENIDNAIDKISNWRTVIGKYKNDDEGIRRSFLIAQDVLNTFPEAVDDSIEENYGVRYSDTIPVLVKAIQEQQEIINDLKARIETLENK